MNWKNKFGFLGGPSSLPPLPDEFIFGVATADHQCEAREENKKEWDDIRDIWEPSVGRTGRGKATEFWDRYAEDIHRAKELGCKAFRFSVSWSRVEADPKTSLEHYENLVDEIIHANMNPVITLHHFVWPPKVDMIHSGFPDVFRDYTTKVVERLSGKVKYWVPFNEPNHLIWGYIKPFWASEYGFPPGRIRQGTDDESNSQIETVGKLIPNLYRAYARAYDEIKGANPDAEVGTNPWVFGFPPWLQWLLDFNAERMGKQMKSIEDWKNQRSILIDHKPLDHGRADLVLATFTRTPNRELKVNFSSEVYFETEQRLLVRMDSKAVAINDLAGKVIAVVEGSTAENSVRRLPIKSGVPLAASDLRAALKLLDNKRADGFLSDLSILQGLMQQNPGQYRLIDQPLETERYAVAVTQGHRKLLHLVDQAIWRFKISGEWAESYAKHIGDGSLQSKFPTGPNRIQDFKDLAMQEGLSPLEVEDPSLQRILKRGFLTVAVKSDAYGLSWKDPETGEFSGLEIDLARAIARRIFGDSRNVEFRAVTAKNRFSELITWRGFIDSLIKMYCVLSTVFAYSNWWYLGLAGKLPTFICPAECWDEKGQPKLDFIGLDYYYGIRSLRPDLIIGLLDSGFKGDFNEAPIWPEALHDSLNHLSNLINNPEVLNGHPTMPLYVLENGWVDVREKPMDRVAYIKEHIHQVQRAKMAGLDVKMYIYWSLTTNSEWGQPIGPNTDFGLFHVDLKEEQGNDNYQKRIPASDGVCKLYKDIIQNREVLQK